MPEPVLKITPIKYGGESTVISMRLSRDLVKDIDAIAAATGRNRNENPDHEPGVCTELYRDHD